MGFILGPKLKTCSQNFWTTTRAMALLALGLGPPLLPRTKNSSSTRERKSTPNRENKY